MNPTIPAMQISTSVKRSQSVTSQLPHCDKSIFIRKKKEKKTPASGKTHTHTHTEAGACHITLASSAIFHLKFTTAQ